MSCELLDQVRDAATVEDMHRVLDALYANFTRQLDDLDLVAEAVDNGDRYGELLDQTLLLKRACDHARTSLTEANALVAVPLAKALVVACVAAAAFAGGLSPAAAEAVQLRQAKRDGAAKARAGVRRSMDKPIIDAAVAEARRRRLSTRRPRPPTPNSFALDILDEVNRLLAERGSKIVVKRDAVANRLRELDRQDLARLERESLFG
jgi:hypothetical protein